MLAVCYFLRKYWMFQEYTVRLGFRNCKKIEPGVK